MLRGVDVCFMYCRFEKDGETLLVLTPREEEAMVSQLQQRKIPIQKIE